MCALVCGGRLEENAPHLQSAHDIVLTMRLGSDDGVGAVVDA